MKSKYTAITSESHRMTFGKYKNRSVSIILSSDPAYIVWLKEDGICEVSDDIYRTAREMVEVDNYIHGQDLWDYMAD